MGWGQRGYMVKLENLMFIKLLSMLDSTLFTELKNIKLQNGGRSKLVRF